MSFTLATVADALIEFILSLLRDPELRAEFAKDPDAVLAQRGLDHASVADVQSVAPVIIERTQVVQVPVVITHAAAAAAAPVEQHHSNPVVREIQQVTNHFAWVDDRDTIIDQSVNQNIWAQGDVTQTFDNEAVTASGDHAIAGAGDVHVDKTTDQSTTITAGDDVNVGNDTTVSVIDDSFGHETDATTTSDDSTDIQVDDSGNDHSTDVAVTDSANQQGDAADPQGDAADPQEDAAPADADQQADTTPAEAAEPAYTDSAAEYAGIDADQASDDSFTSPHAVIEESATDDNF
ncbi:IniB N-terminal domain-containing protein [uncultured Microbacterium sp.]|uniref:IniB N-terminal domain-containing protein n=1 Tax=uncultured Microbacterium sp. TaxID=191216 RepID=UPI0035C9806A